MKYLTLLILLISFTGVAQTADELVEKAIAQKEVRPGDYSIKKDLKAALKINPKHEAALYELALYHINRNTDIYALDLLNTVIEVNPQNAEYYWLRAVVNIRPSAFDEELQQAKDDIDKAIALGWSQPEKVAKARKYIEKYITE